LVSAEHGLADPVAARAGTDAVLRLLADVDDSEVATRRRRLAHALAHFDAATIATTHQFCQQMLAGLGIIGDADPQAVFVESIDDLLTEIVDDFYVRKYGPGGADRPAFSRDTALTIARRAVHDPQAGLEPAHTPAGSAAHVRHSFAVAVRAELHRRKRARGHYTYADMLTRLAGTLTDPARGPAACARLRERYRVVLVDEFQDTDPVQWDILRRAFHGHTTLVLIGDPKQAIYAFRGADVVSYLDAVGAADAHATLAVNHRSDAPLLDALHTVFGGAALGDGRIVVRPVGSAHPGQRLGTQSADGSPGGSAGGERRRGDATISTPLRLRVLPHSRLPIPPGKSLAMVAPVREIVARDVAADVSRLLASPARLRVPTGDTRPVRPGDVAVLVRTNAQGVQVRDALDRAGVPGVLAGMSSVFGTPVAGQWLTLLEAVEQPQRSARVRAAALTCFLGHTVAELCAPHSDALLDSLGATVRGWAAVLHDRGVAALLEAVSTSTGLPRRLLAEHNGERRLTDLRHIGQALHGAAAQGHLGPAALVDWLRHRIADATGDTGAERSRRMESDADAVQIITVHRSKGCEFPIVYVPFGWDRHAGDPDVALLHDGGARVLDVGGPGGDTWRERCEQHRAEEAGEDLRLLYVAMTRACCQVITWWAPTTTTAASPLHRLLFGRPAPGTEVKPSYRVPPEAAALAALNALASPVFAVEEVVEDAGSRWQAPPAEVAELTAAHFGRRLDTSWRRTSYSALTADAHAPHAEAHALHAEAHALHADAHASRAGMHGTRAAPDVTSEPEEQGIDDEAPAPSPARPDEGVPAATAALRPVTATLPVVLSPMADLPAGTGFGTLVHAVLEATDTTASNLLAELTDHTIEQLDLRPVDGLDANALAAALVPVIETPLGPLAGHLRLREVARADRLSELDFEFPLAGGDQAGRDRFAPELTLGDLAPVLRRHLPHTDPLAGYVDALSAPALADQPLRGYLSGSIDAVLRLPGPRFLVVDYKTNWLGPIRTEGCEPLTAGHYSPPVLAQAMIAAQYPLQALIYAVALHRFLRWRQPGYDPERQLGGVLYLFLRGMCGPHTPTVDSIPCGVFGWAPPVALVCELSGLLHGARCADAVLGTTS
ncbi:MAG: UvrD-helicase domain-containing protein, partial [Pseudonocardia sp.]